MKKKSRFLTGLLSAVMALSLFALPASADSTGTTKVGPLPADIETTKTGTVTIHKYEYNGAAPEDNRKGTGEATVDKGKVPEGATLLGNVTFTLYQVKSGEELIDYYEGLQAGKVEQLKIDNYVNMKTYKISDENAYTGKTYTITTSNKDADKGIGSANIPVGIYAVVETSAPASVTGKTKPFMLSVPMTDATGKNWLYDIDIYPKNQTSYKGIDLVKYGKTGSENAEGELLEGFTFTLDKWNETGSWTKIEKASKDGQDNAGDKLNLTTGQDGKISVNNLTKGIYRFTEVSGPNDSNYIIDTKTHYVFEVKESDNGLIIAAVETPNLKWNDGDYNYDAVTKNEGSDAIVVDNYKPDLNKTVQKREKNEKGEHDYVNDTDYSVGDEITYKLEVVVPENVADLKTFYVEDHPNKSNQLAYVAGSISVKAPGQENALEDKKDYLFTEDKTNGGFKVDFKDVTVPTIGNYKGKTLVITYKYKLLTGASSDTAGNVNKAELTYSHNTKTGAEGEDKPGKIHNEAVVYTFATKILKKGDDGKTLNDVEFKLYKDVSNEEYDPKDKDILSTADAKKLGLPTDNNQVWKLVGTQTTSNGGNAEFKGLSNGTYYLVETKTNAGYNLLSGPVEATLTITHETVWATDKVYNEDGKLIYNKHTENTTTFKNADKSENGYITITVINRKGFDLPVTGGFGTLLFSGIGALLVVGGVGVLMSTKKKKGNT